MGEKEEGPVENPGSSIFLSRGNRKRRYASRVLSNCFFVSTQKKEFHHEDNSKYHSDKTF